MATRAPETMNSCSTLGSQKHVKKADFTPAVRPVPASIKLVACPCCSTMQSRATVEDWYFEKKLVRAALAGPYDPEPAGTKVWQCVICKNRRKVTPAKAMTFILTYL